MNLSGTLSDWTLGDLLNVMKVTGKTASLHIKGRRTGVVHFSKGQVVGAALDGNAVPTGEFESRAAASDALFVLSALSEGSFEVGPFEGNESDGWDVDSLLSDMHQLESLEADLVGAGMRDTLLMLRDRITEPVTIQVEDWWALASLVSVLSFDQLEEVFGRGRAIRLLHTLWRLDLMETVEQESRSIEAEEAAPTTDTVPMVADKEPSALDLSGLDQAGADRSQEAEEPETIAPSTERHDESWLDEIAAAAEPDRPQDRAPTLSETRRVLGVAAPASTVLTGAVLDEMRRLRVRPTAD